MNAVIVLGVVIAFLSLLYNVFDIPKIQPQKLKGIFATLRRGLPKVIYIIIASALSIVFLFVIYTITRMPLQLDVVLVDILMFWALLGIWSPIILTKYDKIKKPFEFTNIVLFFFVMTGFWIVQWPQWQTPALLTSIVVFMFILLLVYSLIEKRKARRSC